MKENNILRKITFFSVMAVLFSAFLSAFAFSGTRDYVDYMESGNTASDDIDLTVVTSPGNTLATEDYVIDDPIGISTFNMFSTYDDGQLYRDVAESGIDFDFIRTAAAYSRKKTKMYWKFEDVTKLKLIAGKYPQDYSADNTDYVKLDQHPNLLISKDAIDRLIASRYNDMTYADFIGKVISWSGAIVDPQSYEDTLWIHDPMFSKTELIAGIFEPAEDEKYDRYSMLTFDVQPNIAEDDRIIEVKSLESSSRHNYYEGFSFSNSHEAFRMGKYLSGRGYSVRYFYGDAGGTQYGALNKAGEEIIAASSAYEKTVALSVAIASVVLFHFSVIFNDRNCPDEYHERKKYFIVTAILGGASLLIGIALGAIAAAIIGAASGYMHFSAQYLYLLAVDAGMIIITSLIRYAKNVRKLKADYRGMKAE